MKTITLKVDDCDDIVVADLMETYHLHNRFDKIDCSNDTLEPDYTFLKAIQTVLEYYMVHEEWVEWVKENPIVTEK